MGRATFRVGRGLLVAALLSTAAGAEVVAPAAAKPAELAPEEPTGSPGELTSDEETEEAPLVRVSGRVFARASADERRAYARALGIPSARLGVAAELGRLEAEVSADLADQTMLKDAFVRLADEAKRYRLYGGQFKSPFLARSLDSRWGLPLVSRGLVEDYLVERNQLGGRRPGLMAELKAGGALKLKAAAGVFQGGRDELGLRLDEDVAGRVSLRPVRALTLGASSYLTGAFEGTRTFAAATDMTLRWGGLQLTGELVGGRLTVGPFLGQIAAASYNVPLGTSRWAIQPVVGAEGLQLRWLDARGHALTGGVNVLYAERFKAQLQAERALRPGDAAPGTELTFQLATRF